MRKLTLLNLDGRTRHIASVARSVAEALEGRRLSRRSHGTTFSSATPSWNSAANWTPNTSYPSTSSDSANLNVDVAVNQSITLGADLSVNAMTLGDSTTTGGTGQTETIASGQTLTFDNGSSSASLTLASGSVANATLACSMVLNSDLLITNNSSHTLTISGNIDLRGHTLTVTDSGSVTISGSISSSVAGGTVVKDGPAGGATLTLSGSNSYTGGTTVNDGVLELESSTAVGTSGTLTINGSNSGTDGTVVQMSGNISVPSGVSLAMNSGDSSKRASLKSISGSDVWNGPIVLTGSTTDQFYAAGSSLTINGNTTGSTFTGNLTIRGDSSGTGTANGTIQIPSGALVKTDSSTWTINSTGNEWDGTSIDASTLRLGVSNALPTSTVVAIGQSGGDGVLDLNGYDQEIAGLAIGSGATASKQSIGNSSTSSNSILTVDTSAGSSSFSGILKDVVGSGTQQLALVVQGTNSLTLSGANTFSGGIDLLGGTLYLGGSAPFNGQAVLSIASTASLYVDGSLLGNTTNASGWTPQGSVTFSGAGTASSPQMMEAMSQDDGATVAGFANNFAYGPLALSGATYVQLEDNSQNATSGANAVYAASLSVPQGATLDLNGLHLYTMASNVVGAVINGTVTIVGVPPALASSQVGNGSAQRSSLTSFQIAFKEPVNFTAASFTVEYETVADNQAYQAGSVTTQTFASLPNSADISFSSPDGGTTWVFSPTLGGTVDRTAGAGNSAGQAIFDDGVYRLILHGAAITDMATGAALFNAGADEAVSFNDGSGTAHTDFDALFGDLTGVGVVNNSDVSKLRTAFSGGTGAYNAALDYRGIEAQLSNLDVSQFKKRFLVTLLL